MQGLRTSATSAGGMGTSAKLSRAVNDGVYLQWSKYRLTNGTE